LSADGITLEGFNATNSGGWEVDEAGIKITSSNNMITDNNVRNGTIEKSSDFLTFHPS